MRLLRYCQAYEVLFFGALKYICSKTIKNKEVYVYVL